MIWYSLFLRTTFYEFFSYGKGENPGRHSNSSGDCHQWCRAVSSFQAYKAPNSGRGDFDASFRFLQYTPSFSWMGIFSGILIADHWLTDSEEHWCSCYNKVWTCYCHSWDFRFMLCICDTDIIYCLQGKVQATKCSIWWWKAIISSYICWGSCKFLLWMTLFYFSLLIGTFYLNYQYFMTLMGWKK